MKVSHMIWPHESKLQQFLLENKKSVSELVARCMRFMISLVCHIDKVTRVRAVDISDATKGSTEELGLLLNDVKDIDMMVSRP